MLLVIITIMDNVKWKSSGTAMRLTNPRRAILDELEKEETHLTADEVYEKVRRKLPRVSLGTIYRNLEILAEHGLIRKIELAGQQKMFDGNMQKHYHLQCIKCNKLVDIPVDMVTVDFSKSKDDKNCKITGYNLELIGVCSRCRMNARGKE